MNRFGRWQDLVLPLSLIACVFVILVPLPAGILDVLLSANVTIGLIVLLTTIYVQTPLEFSIFPSLLLATTLGRLVLNVASTRLILTGGGTFGLDAGGGVIRAFGEFVAGNNTVVGLVIFVIIIVIQFVVITKGATRISEVAARFALDGMPGRQMAIDADLSNGAIDEHEARRRRSEIQQQADFFGAMDGASKFVRGDAIAGIVITLINIIGGLVIGMLQDGMTMSEAGEVFTKLTIGDGLVSQVPALLISLAAGLLVTRSSQATNLPAEFVKQLLSRPQSLGVSAAALALLVFTELPKLPLLTIGAGCLALATMIRRQQRQQTVASQAALAKSQAAEQQKKPDDRIEEYLAVDPMEMEIGVGLIRLADPNRGGDLLPRITGVRQTVASEIGIVLPKVRIRDNMRLGERHYRVKIANNSVAEGVIHPDRLLAMHSGTASGNLPGEATRDPAFGQPAVWIDAALRDRAGMLGYTVVEPSTVMATHLKELVRQHADELLTRDATKKLIEELKKSSPAVVDELIPGQMKLAEVQMVLQSLLREQVPIRQLGVILETLGDYAGRTKDPIVLGEYVRHRLSRTICTQYRDAEHRLYAITLEPTLDDRIAGGIEHSERGLFVRLAPAHIDRICDAISKEVEKLQRLGKPPVLFVSPQIRPGLRQMTQTRLPKLVIMSFNELTRDTRLEAIGMVTDVAPGR